MAKTEGEVQGGYTSRLFLSRPAVRMKYYTLIELKYIKKTDY